MRVTLDGLDNKPYSRQRGPSTVFIASRPSFYIPLQENNGTSTFTIIKIAANMAIRMLMMALNGSNIGSLFKIRYSAIKTITAIDRNMMSMPHI